MSTTACSRSGPASSPRQNESILYVQACFMSRSSNSCASGATSVNARPRTKCLLATATPVAARLMFRSETNASEASW